MSDKFEEYRIFELLHVKQDGDDLFNLCDGPISENDRQILCGCIKAAESILLEREYIDKDYRNVYSGYYSKKFSRAPSRAIRLHLFDVKLELDDLRHNINNGSFDSRLTELAKQQNKRHGLKGTTDGYIGYIVLRPTEYSRIGRCLLDPRKLFSFNSNQVVGCLAHYSAEIMGHKLKVCAFPHQSQDAEVHICAHTAVWSLFRYLSQRYPYYPEQYPYDIALLNKDLRFGRLLPGRGLYMDQVTAMFGQFGLSAEMYMEDLIADVVDYDGTGWAAVKPIEANQNIQNKEHLLHLLHCHVDSGMPPVVGLPGHAVVALGVAYSDRPQIKRNSQTIPSTDFITGIIVNDDNHAPYQIAMRRGLKSGENNTGYACDDIDSMVVPLPDKVFLTAEKAEILVTDLVDSLGPPIQPNGNSWSSCNAENPDAEKYVRRLYCTSSRNYKEFRLNNCDVISAKLLEQPLPHFLWITEFTPLSLWNKEKSVVAEVALDATAGPYDEEPFVWIRYPGVLMLNLRRLYGSIADNVQTAVYNVSDISSLTFSKFQDNLVRFS